MSNLDKSADDGKFVDVRKEDLYPEILKKHSIAESQRIKEARERSVSDERPRDMRKKRNFKDKIQKALIAFTIVAVMGGGYALVDGLSEKAPTTISEGDRNNIDSIISFYNDKVDFVMSNNISTDSNSQFFEKQDAISKYLLDAASKSELEFRCALLGTAKSLHGGMFLKTLDNMLPNVVVDNNKYKDCASLIYSGTSQKLLENLGYKDFEEYWEKERKAIYQLFVDKGLASSEAEVASILATGDFDYNFFDSTSKGKGGK